MVAFGGTEVKQILEFFVFLLDKEYKKGWVEYSSVEGEQRHAGVSSFTRGTRKAG